MNYKLDITLESSCREIKLVDKNFLACKCNEPEKSSQESIPNRYNCNGQKKTGNTRIPVCEFVQG
ncbi:MAG TPA: hypothetical protein PKK99_03730 [Bacteroidia bacterium]|nr:hypothetical protein [Bacteroidia bacterium]